MEHKINQVSGSSRKDFYIKSPYQSKYMKLLEISSTPELKASLKAFISIWILRPFKNNRVKTLLVAPVPQSSQTKPPENLYRSNSEFT